MVTVLCLARLLIQDARTASFCLQAIFTSTGCDHAHSAPVRSVARHDSRSHLHHRARNWQGNAAPPALHRVVTVTLFVRAHLLDDRARASVRLRQAMQVSFEMLDHLALGFRDEAEAGAVARESGQRADRERAGVPQRIEQAGPAAQFVDARRRTRPDGRSPRGPLPSVQPGLHRAAGHGSLALVQRLGGDLAGMIDPHQRGGVLARSVVG